MAADALLALQASTTKTATFNGTGKSLPYGSNRELFARVIYSAAANASGSNTAIFSLEYTVDGGSTWTTGFVNATITLSTTAQAAEVYLPIEFPLSAKVLATPANAQVRLSVTIAGAGTSPTITYYADITAAAP
jgi:hypothetical protein